MALKKEQVHAAATYSTEAEQDHKPAKEKKTAISFYVRPSIYEQIRRLARFKGVAAGTLIDEVLEAYLNDHRAELEAYDNLTAQLQAQQLKK